MKIYDNSIFEAESNKRFIDLIIFILLDVILIGTGLCLIFSEKNSYIAWIFLGLGIFILILTIFYIIIKNKEEKKRLDTTFGKILHDIESKNIKNILTNMGVDVSKCDCRILKREALLSSGIAYNDYCYSEVLLTKDNYYYSVEPMEEYFHLVSMLPNDVKELIGSDNKLYYDNITKEDIYNNWLKFTKENEDNASLIEKTLKKLTE